MWAKANNIMISAAESCTGGLLMASLTQIAGSSAVLDRGFVTYSNQSKTQMLDVPVSMMEQYGAVSEPVARAMAVGALIHSDANIALSITGIAGPGGGTPQKPVGHVCFGFAAYREDGEKINGEKIISDKFSRNFTIPDTEENHLCDEAARAYIREQSVLFAFDLLFDHGR